MLKIIFRYSLFVALTLSVAGYFRASAPVFAENQKDNIAVQQTHFQSASIKFENQEIVFVEIDEKEEEETERSSLKKHASAAFLGTNFSTLFLAFSHTAQLQADHYTHLLAHAQPTYLLLRVFRL